MKSQNTHPNSLSVSISTPAQGDSNKLLSLLALATGAAAMPQSGMADIIYRNLDSEGPPTVGYSGGNIASYFFDDLPGTVQLGFQRQQFTYTTTLASQTYRYRFVTAGHQGGAAASIRGTLAYGSAVVLPKDATWSQGTGLPFSYVTVGFAGEMGHYPEFGFDNQYLAWVFTDSTQGDAQLYGWIQVSLMILNYPTGPNVTIHGYAYESTPGVKPLMGQVPEPNSAGLIVLGALALGSRGLRKWRQSRTSSRND